MNSEAQQIIKKNLSLPTKYRHRSVLDMVKEQEELIEQFRSLGFSREQFFKSSRIAAKNETPHKV